MQKPSDLIGKKVAVVAVNANCDLLLNDELRKQGHDYKTIGYVPLNIPDMGPTLARGGIDAACIPEPALSFVMGQGASRSVMDLFADDRRGMPAVGFAATGQFANKNPRTIAAVQRALDKARHIAHTEPKRIRDILPSFINIKPDIAAKIALPEFPETSEAIALQRVSGLMQRLGVLQGEVKTPTLFRP